MRDMGHAALVEYEPSGTLRLGWSLRYKRKLTAKDPAIGKAWYIPGYGRYDDRIGGTFNVIIEL